MSRKDYEAIARVIHWANVSEKQRIELAHDFASMLARDNARFDSARFIQAAMPESSPYRPLNVKG